MTEYKKVPANPRASSRGNTGGASVIRNYWAYRVRRQYCKLYKKF